MREWRTGWKQTEDGKRKIKESQIPFQKKVVCYETRLVFDSIAEAAKYCSVNSSNIISACNGFPKQKSGGFHWYRLEDYPIDYQCEIPPNTKKPRAVVCVNTGVLYSSISQAAKETGTDARHISRCCKEKKRKVNGVYWRYEEEYKKECVLSPII